jgi:hypothetical protein
MTGLANISSIFKGETHSLVGKGAPHQQAGNCLTVTKIYIVGSRCLATHSEDIEASVFAVVVYRMCTLMRAM